MFICYHVADLLQWDFLKSGPSMQAPLHLDGTAPMPASLKLGDSGQIPVAEAPSSAGMEKLSPGRRMKERISS